MKSEQNSAWRFHLEYRGLRLAIADLQIFWHDIHNLGTNPNNISINKKK